MDKWPENKLIRALGDRGATREQATDYLMKTYIRFVPTIEKKVNISRTDALDAYVDAIVELTEQVAMGKFKGESKLSSYLYKIFYYKSVDLFRKNTTNKLDYRESMPESSDTNLLADKEMEINEAVSQVHMYLDKLGEPCKQILIDWGFWGYNMTEIAARVGLEGSVQAKDRKYKCLQKLRQLMK